MLAACVPKRNPNSELTNEIKKPTPEDAQSQQENKDFVFQLHEDGTAELLSTIQTGSFYSDVMGWSSDTWIFENGQHPTLK